MGSKEYFDSWLQIKEQLRLNLQEDARIQQFAINFVGIKPQATAVEVVARVYCKYCELYNKLCDIYDQMLQPQRQEYIKKIIDALTCRILEVKTILEDVEAFQYTYSENAMQQLLMVPQDVQILCPFFYPFEIRQQEKQYIVDEILSGNRLGDPSPTPSEIERKEEERLEQERIKKEEKDAEIKKKIAMGEEILEETTSVVFSPEELAEMKAEEEYKTHVLNIQRMQRSRKVIKIREQQKNKDNNLYIELAGLKKPRARENFRYRAAQLVMKMYRKFMELKRSHMKENKLKMKLDMVMLAYNPPSAKLQLEKIKEIRREFRRNYYEKWMQATLKEKSRVFKLREGDIMQDISDEIRQWWREWYQDCRVFDEFPYPEEGGSILVVRGDTFSTDEFIEWRKAEEKRIKQEAQNPKTKDDIKAQKKAAKEEKKRLALEAKERERKRIRDYKKQRFNPVNDPGIYYNIGTNLKHLQEAWFEYTSAWNEIDICDPDLTAIKGHIQKIITENVYQEIQLELRPVVDEIMRLELDLLRKALKLDCKLAQVKVSIVQKRKKPKKVKPPKPDKSKPAVLFQRLVDRGIVKKYPRVTLDDYWGDKNYAAADLRAIPWTPGFPPPCIGDVKEQVRIRCILALGSSCSNAQRSQLLAGPRNCAKKTLIYAIATETNSILIDLSPMNVYDKYPGSKGLKTLINSVNKISRLMQPTVIMVENADKLYYKKVPKEEKQFDPTRLSKDLFREIIKPLKKDDKVLVMGTAAEPWLGKTKTMKKAFPSVILIPTADYGSISFVLTKMLMKYQGVDREFDVHSVAQTIRGYDIDTIKKAVESVLNSNRIAELSFKPLHPLELVNAVLANEDAAITEKDDVAMFWEWYLSYSPFGEKITYYLSMLEAQLAFKLKAEKQEKQNKKMKQLQTN